MGRVTAVWLQKSRLGKMKIIILLLTLSPLVFANMPKFRVYEETSPYKCYEKDTAPVDTGVIFDDGHCTDIHGNKFLENSNTTSCCECLYYTCVYVDTYRDQKLFQWNVSVSDHCCLHCDDIVYKADSIIDTIQHEDECKTIETTVCRTIPGYQKAVVEYEFNYRNCCNDEEGLSALETTKLEPKSCSQRLCYYKDALLSSTWISSKVLSGCDCCVVDGQLVSDGHSWVKDGKVYECCRGDIVIKLQDDLPATSTNTTTSTTASPTTTTTRTTPTKTSPTRTSPTRTSPTKTSTTTRPSQSVNEVRLVGGRNSKEGNVLLNGRPICDDAWQHNDAKVVCRMLGHDPENSAARSFSHFGSVSTNFTMSYVGCRGTEMNIANCSSRFYRNCSASEGAGVICDYKPSSSSTIELVGGNVTKLINGNITYEGNVLFNGKPICDYSWDDRDARVVCSMLGYGTAGSYASRDSKYGKISNKAYWNHFFCEGTEKYLGMCQHRNYSRSCPNDVAGVICGLVGRTSEVPLQLVGGSNKKEGNVLLYGQPICNYNWDTPDAKVICRMAGYDPDNSVALTGSSFGNLYPNVAMNYVRCKGSERNISDCPSSTSNWCYEYYLAGVRCEYDTTADNITLVGGNSTNEGNVLVNGKPISDNRWDDKDAQVVCRTLGFSDKNATATTRSKFGRVSTGFSMQEVTCDGTESHISLCTHDATPGYFSSFRGAGVICGVILY